MPGFFIPIAGDGCNVAVPKGGPSNIVETARNHRYLLQTFPPLGARDTGLLIFLAKCSRPAMEFEEIIIHSAQDEIYRPGKSKPKPVEFTFYEKLNGSAGVSDLSTSPGQTTASPGVAAGKQVNQCAQMIYAWWAKNTLNINNSLFAAPGAFLQNAQLDMLDGNGDPVWSYFLYDAWPVSVSPSDLDYSNNEISTIVVKLRYSRCVEVAG